jgi:MFS family permease
MTAYILMLGGGALLFVAGALLAERYARRRRGRRLFTAGFALGVLLLGIALQGQLYVAAVALTVILLLWVVGRTGVGVGLVITAGLILAAWTPLGTALASVLLVGAFLGRVGAAVASGGLARAISSRPGRRSPAPGEVGIGAIEPVSSLSPGEQLARHVLHPDIPRGFGL